MTKKRENFYGLYVVFLLLFFVFFVHLLNEKKKNIRTEIKRRKTNARKPYRIRLINFIYSSSQLTSNHNICEQKKMFNKTNYTKRNKTKYTKKRDERKKKQVAKCRTETLVSTPIFDSEAKITYTHTHKVTYI